MTTSITEVDILVRLLSAVACGAALGWEREWHHKPAGLRTIVLISLGAAALTLISIHVTQLTPGDRLDPSRIVQGIIGGIGFLGAGTIIQSGGTVHGMTTAAAIWVAGAAGVACGTGAYSVAVPTVVLCLFILVALRVVEVHLTKGDNTPQQRESPKP